MNDPGAESEDIDSEFTDRLNVQHVNPQDMLSNSAGESLLKIKGGGRSYMRTASGRATREPTTSRRSAQAMLIYIQRMAPSYFRELGLMLTTHKTNHLNLVRTIV